MLKKGIVIYELWFQTNAHTTMLLTRCNHIANTLLPPTVKKVCPVKTGPVAYIGIESSAEAAQRTYDKQHGASKNSSEESENMEEESEDDKPVSSL